jgi:hypothetical protein
MMKNTLLALVLCFLAVNVVAEEINPKPEGKSSLQIGGLLQATMDKQGVEKEDFDIPNARLSLDWVSASKRWEAYLLVNASQFKDEGDWLMSASLTYSLTGAPAEEGGGESKIRLGRIFDAYGYPTPFAAFNETRSYPLADTTATFTHGIQYEYTSKDWLILANVSGKSGYRFDQAESWEGFESSLRLQRNFGKSWLALTLHKGDDNQCVILDSQVQLADNLYVRGALYYLLREGHESDQISGYLLAAWEPVSRWELHAMLDWKQQLSKSWGELQFSKGDDGIVTGMNWVEMESSKAQYTAITIGTRVFFLQDRSLTATIDGVFQLGNEEGANDEVQLGVRISKRFSGKLF